MRAFVSPTVVLALFLGIAAPLRADSLVATPPTNDPEPSVVWSVVGGTVAAMVPLAIGGGMMALSDKTQDRQRRTGLDLIVCGFAIGPIVSHLIGREWKRAAIFGSVSLLFAGIAIGAVEWRDGSVNLASVEAKNVFGAAVTATVVVAATGIIDSMVAGDRWRDRQKKRAAARPTAFVAPIFGPRQGGLAVVGAF